MLDLADRRQASTTSIALVARACQRRLTTPFLLGETMELPREAALAGRDQRALGDVAAGAHSPLEYRYVRDVERAHGLPAADRQARADQAVTVSSATRSTAGTGWSWSLTDGPITPMSSAGAISAATMRRL